MGGAVFAAVTAFGAAVGALWWALAPRGEVTVGADGQPLGYGASQLLFGGEAYFAFLVMGAGLACGFLAYLGQYRVAAGSGIDVRLAALLGLALGAVLASVVAWWTGVQLDAAAAREALAAAAPGEAVRAGLVLRAHGALVLWPLVAVLQFATFDAVSIWRGDLGHQRALHEVEGADTVAVHAEAEDAGARA